MPPQFIIYVYINSKNCSKKMDIKKIHKIIFQDVKKKFNSSASSKMLLLSWNVSQSKVRLQVTHPSGDPECLHREIANI